MSVLRQFNMYFMLVPFQWVIFYWIALVAQ